MVCQIVCLFRYVYVLRKGDSTGSIVFCLLILARIRCELFVYVVLRGRYTIVCLVFGRKVRGRVYFCGSSIENFELLVI